LLYIPVNSGNQLVKKNVILESIIPEPPNKDKDMLHLALLMPYYIIKNDTMFNDFEDTTGISSLYFKSSEAALSFHLGVKLALDSLRNLGNNIILHTFDTNNDTIKTKQIVYSDLLNKMDIIIGPLHARNFSILCERYGNNKDKIIINPLSRLTHSVNKYKSVYQISPSVYNQSVIIKNEIIRKHKNKRVIVLFQDKEKDLPFYIQSLFKKEMRKIKLIEVQSTNIDSIRRFFTEFQVVIIPSRNKAFVSKMLASIGGIDSTSIVFGLNIWKTYDNLDIDNLMELDVHFPITHPFDYNKKHDALFLQLFEDTYNTNQGKYTYIGYNIAMHFCSSNRLFAFKKVGHSGGFVNIKSPLYHYDDYELVPVR